MSDTQRPGGPAPVGGDAADQQQADLRHDAVTSGAAADGQLLVDTASAGRDEKQTSLWGDAWGELRRKPFFWIGGALAVFFLLMALFPALFARGADPRECNLSFSVDTPSAAHWFGYDQQGCDYLAQVVYGARNSLQIGFTAVIGLLVVGVVVGAVAGYFGGWIDSLLARITDVFYALPLILGALILLRVGPTIEIAGGPVPIISERGPGAISVALVIFGWMTAMRLVRSQVIAIKSSDYVAAARALGAGPLRILVRHILPNAVAPVIVYATISVGALIAAEAALTFLGVGLQRPNYSWGLQISEGQNLLRTAPHLVLIPSIVLSLTVMAFVMMGDALRDALDPRQRS
ncbi:oligopeptide transport system permease protein [Pseudokineococcus lusitanus]|uniref:Oligopeptide transport system permease protein n=1 Tax=Pseudokineococcus lusitanus TaxID=763993 RepID=A0A3N1HN72_9ACTN|nr:ABC transporter permease [Pseudokineococcus lusitanus]ROP43967.1 oligopeptide transport system permease protein [Pseudokineococcus lusitanus]